jgi:hypothetical protein
MGGTVACNLNWIFDDVFRPDGFFKDEVTVMLDGGDFADDMTVTIYAEGGSTTLTNRVITPLKVWGGTTDVAMYSAKLRYSDFTMNGPVHIYAKAQSKIVGVADRIIGPIRMYRKSGYDRVIQVGASLTPATNLRYNQIHLAVRDAAALPSDQHVRIEFVEDMVVPVVPSSGTTMVWAFSSSTSAARRGTIDVFANGHNVVVSKPSLPFVLLRPSANGLSFNGIKFDFAYYNMTTEQNTVAGWRPTQFFNCELFSSNGRYELPGDTAGNDATVRVTSFINAYTIKTACWEHDLYDGGNISHWAVGNRLERTGSDMCFVYGGAAYPSNVMYYNTMVDVNVNDLYRNKLPAMELIYTGPGVAKMSRTGVWDSSSVLRLYVDDLEVGAYTPTRTRNTGSMLYYISDAVAKINADLNASGWTARTLDNTRRFSTIGGEGTSGGFTNVAVGSTTQTAGIVTTSFGPHADGVQFSNSSVHDNHLIMHNAFMNVSAQIMFPAIQVTSGSTWNCIFRNNFGSLEVAGNNENSLIVQFNTQMMGPHHHLLMDNNSIPNQQFSIRMDSSASAAQTSLDEFSSIRNNIVLFLTQTARSATAGQMLATVSGNVAFYTSTSGPSGINVGVNYNLNQPPLGSFPKLTQFMVREDFVPVAGSPVRTKLVPTVTKYDVRGLARVVSDIAGAFSLAQ